MPDIRKADIERLRGRLRRDAEEFPELRPLLDALPEDYDPSQAPLELSAETEEDDDVLVSGSGLYEAIQLAAAKTARAKKLQALEAARAQFMRDAAHLNERLLRREITPLAWNLDMRDLVKDLHVLAYVSGKSGEWSSMTASDWGRVGYVLRQQYEFLRSWATELYDLEGKTLAQLNARAGLYAAAASQSFEAGVASEIGVEPAALPSYPGDGTTSCLARCRCRWAIRVISKRRGDYDCRWVLGSAEHCRECRRRAVAWKRLRIRGGRLISEISMEGTFR